MSSTELSTVHQVRGVGFATVPYPVTQLSGSGVKRMRMLATSRMTTVTALGNGVSCKVGAEMGRARQRRLAVKKIPLVLLEYAAGYHHRTFESTTEGPWIATERFGRA